MSQRCTATTKSGTRCPSYARKGQQLCTMHGPNAKEYQSAGGITSGRKLSGMAVMPDAPTVTVDTPKQVRELLGATINHLRRGQLDPKIASGVGYLCSVVLQSFKAPAVDVVDAEARPLREWSREDLLRLARIPYGDTPPQTDD